MGPELSHRCVCRSLHITDRCSDYYKTNFLSSFSVPQWFRIPLVSQVVDKIFQNHVALHSLRPTQNGRHFPDDIFKYISWMKRFEFWMKFWLQFIPTGQIDNNKALIQIMAWCRIGGKPLSKLMMRICVTRPRRVRVKNVLWYSQGSFFTNS